ncbi:endosomal cargo receptor [Basidiobolus meristosporus CBS 931.73]|uniref:Endosomal cargo receptor n=1 Tax=Basidiobolus meristosporus CBS 931.73 TaxID=1314790 RepID=A0A1Y1YV70_9FUNG|nr:endosomal cargo receptor [Basidiobolus meristosporus CBS 931.73]|eukprot:ORY01943.1 endosomal cargo receptor [Basidiobolus meristosporus CBS 931.73]
MKCFIALVTQLTAYITLLLSTYTAEGTSLTYWVPANDRSCFFAWVDEQGKKVYFYFAVQTGGNFDIDYEITDPRSRIIAKGEKERQVDMLFTGNEVGEYTFCFSNGMSTFAEKLVDFNISVEKEAKALLPHRQALEEHHTNPTEESITRIGGSLYSINHLLKYFRTRENRNFATVRSTESRVFWYSLLECALIVGIASFQVFAIRKLFSTNKKGHI